MTPLEWILTLIAHEKESLSLFFAYSSRSIFFLQHSRLCATIATYQFNFRVLHHPSSRGFCGPIGQYVEHLMRLYVHDDRAEFASPSDPKSRQCQSVAPIQLVLWAVP